MRKYLFPFTLFVLAIVAILPNACKHEPNLIPTDPNGQDTTLVPVDSVDLSGFPCSSDTVYFQNQI